jgi:hypothetical protein
MTAVSIQDIADAPLATIEAAITDGKVAKSLQTSCKAHMRRPPKRAAPEAKSSTASKRSRTGSDAMGSGHESVSAADLERSLSLPVSVDEHAMTEAVLYTNRAPVMLAFTVELLRYTMPEQPISSRLSLAQAVVSANSRSKAVSLGLEKGPAAEEESWGEGQPKVTIMGRTISVLKRGGYEWRGDEVAVDEKPSQQAREHAQEASETAPAQPAGNWSASPTLSSRSSTFIAHATQIASLAEKAPLFDSLMDANPRLKTATHNAWAVRFRDPNYGVREDSYDDGETGCGAFLLRILREAEAMDVMVIMTRWFGGVLLGPDRWRLMRNVVTQALAERLRRHGNEGSLLGGEALWALDLENMKSKSVFGGQSSAFQPVVGAAVHRPESARDYLLKSFATAPTDATVDGSAAQGVIQGQSSPTKSRAKGRAKAQVESEKEGNLSLFLGALRLLYDSWADNLTPRELDQKAWSWYVAVRPDVESGLSGWGAKGSLALRRILDLRRKESSNIGLVIQHGP